MSDGLICDQCGETLRVNARGDDEMGERAGWLTIALNDGTLKADLCTRSCALEWLNDDDVAAAMTDHAEVIAGIARAIRGEGDDDG